MLSWIVSLKLWKKVPYAPDLADSDGPNLARSKGIGLKQLGDDYSVALMSGVQRIRTLVVLIQEFLTYQTS